MSPDQVSTLARETVIPILGLLIGLISIILSRRQMRLLVIARGEQQVGKNYDWIIKLTVSNVGYYPISITHITNSESDNLTIKSTHMLPFTLQSGSVENLEIDFEYTTKNFVIYVRDHKGKNHKVKIKKEPSLIKAESWSQILQSKELRTAHHIRLLVKDRVKSIVSKKGSSDDG